MTEHEIKEVLGEVAPGGRPVSPEVVLWAAVVERVFIDAFQASDNMLAGGRTWKLNSPDFDPAAERAESRRWLISDLDPWRADREDACDLAGLDPDKMQSIAREMVRKVEAEEAAAEAAGCKVERHTYNKRLPRRFDIRFSERAEDLERLAELEKLDAEFRSAELSAHGQRRARLYWERKRMEAAEALVAMDDGVQVAV